MIIIPERELIIINPPRTGSTTIRNTVRAHFEYAFMPYRHMEADGVPFGYERYRKVCVIRDPVDRLWSLYKFIRSLVAYRHSAWQEANQYYAFKYEFNEWIIHNKAVFSCNYQPGHALMEARYTVRRPMPENVKSQREYAVPELGTDFVLFEDLDQFLFDLVGVVPMHLNGTDSAVVPRLVGAAYSYVHHVFAWDYEIINGAPRWQSQRSG